jgi:hypothetical protein
MQKGYTTMTIDDGSKNNGDGKAQQDDDPDKLDELDDRELGHDVDITKATRRRGPAGDRTWVSGTIAGHRFEALVFPDHASNRDYEIEDSRITKLLLQQQADQKTVYHWDRGLVVAAQNPAAQRIVAFLCDGLAAHVYGRPPEQR